MTLEFVTGDCFATDEKIALAHGCNCSGAMGKGIAVEFKRRWPLMYENYKIACKSGDFLLGDVYTWKDDLTKRVIFNMATQKSWRSKATLGAIRQALKNTVAEAEKYEVACICMPLVGTGLGGLNVDSVKNLMAASIGRSKVRFLVCDRYINETPIISSG